MALFPAAVAAQMATGKVSCALLVEFHFASGIGRAWTGFGDRVFGGNTWQGTNGLARIEGLSQSRDGSAEQATFTLPGVESSLLAKVVGSPDEYANRAVKVFLQFLDGDGQALDSPVAIWAGFMDRPEVSRSDGEEGSARIIKMTAENIFASRARPPYGAYSDRDQQARYLGDLGFERVGTLINAVREWPKT
jgi:hypothetical protein